MQKKSILFSLIVCLITACGNNPANEEKPVEKAATPPPVYKMDMLEKMFNNDNWMKVDGKDTSYYYFSRIPSEIQIHQYRMIKGDSVITNMSAIRFSNDSLIWRYNDSTYLFLSAITEKTSEWTRIDKDPPGSFYMAFEPKGEKHITLFLADKKQFVLTRTPSLSIFLVRSRYDYLHGTNYAFSDTVFSGGKKK
jgi:translation initiation factor IF-1